MSFHHHSPCTVRAILFSRDAVPDVVIEAVRHRLASDSDQAGDETWFHTFSYAEPRPGLPSDFTHVHVFELAAKDVTASDAELTRLEGSVGLSLQGCGVSLLRPPHGVWAFPNLLAVGLAYPSVFEGSVGLFESYLRAR